VALPLIGVYRVEDAALPSEALSGHVPTPLPGSIPFDKVMTNIVQNVDFKSWSENARNMWFKDFKSDPSKAVISDTYWFCIIFYFQAGKFKDVEQRLFSRISANFVGLFSTVGHQRKDFFFKSYADAVAQAVLYSMFVAYPKSRVNFTDAFRKELVSRISYWTTGICPEFVDTSHWKLNLGGGDVLQSAPAQAFQKPADATGGRSLASAGAAGQPMFGMLSADSLKGTRASLAHRAPRPTKTLRYSPLVAHFLRARRYTSVNLVQSVKMRLTTAEERVKLVDAKHANMVERANQSCETCDRLAVEYEEMMQKVKREERLRNLQAQTAKRRLEVRRKEVLRTDPHEYANYLVQLHNLQPGASYGAAQGAGQGA